MVTPGCASARPHVTCLHDEDGTYLVMLVKLATESNCEVARCSAGNCIGGVQGFATVIGAPAFADLHILEARLHAEKEQLGAFWKLLKNNYLSD